MTTSAFNWLRLGLFVVLVTLSSSALAQNVRPSKKEPIRRGLQERWLATSNTALAITGDIKLSPTKLTMARRDYPLTLVRDIDAQHLSDIGKSFASDHPTAARLYKTRIPAKARLLNGNDICGPWDANWLLAVNENNTDDNGPTLSLAFFSGDSEPHLDYEAIENTTNLCETYGYSH